MKKLYILIITVLLGLLPVCGAVRMTLDECIDSALVRNPGLRAELKNVEKSRILIGTAFDAPNTGIELSQDATDGGGMENGLTFSQEFEFPTVYVARRQMLKADYLVTESAYGSRKNEVCARIVSSYYRLLYLKARLAALERLEEHYGRFVAIASARFEAGEGSRLEALGAERLRDKTLLSIRDVHGQLKAERVILMQAVGLAEEIEPVEDELTVLEVPEAYLDIIPEQTTVGQLLDARVAQSRRALEVARQDFLPGLFVSATSQLLIRSFNPYHVERPRFRQGDFMGFQVGITVPLFFGAKRARLLAARRDVEKSLLEREDEYGRIRGDYAEALAEYSTATDNLRYYEKGGLEQAREIARLARVSYELGEIDYVEYMRNLEDSSAIEMEYLECVDRFNQAVVRLRSLKGI